MPVFLTGRNPDNISLPEFLDLTSPSCTQPEPAVTIRI